jgi:cytochrome P450
MVDLASAPPEPTRIPPPRGAIETLRLLRTIVRNPIDAWPIEIYSEPFVRARFLGRDVVFVMEPELIREMLVDRADAFEKADTAQRVLKPALGEAILTAEGARWRWQRRIAAPIFRHERILGFVPQMLAAAEATAERWAALPEGATVSVAHEMMRTTFAIIVETMLPGPARIDAARVGEAITAMLDATGWQVAITLIGAPAWTPYPGKRRADRARDYLRAEVRRLVAGRRGGGAARDDLIGLLLEAKDPESGRGMSDDDVADNLLTFITAGHETTALALTWAFHLIGRHPEAAEAISREVGRVAGGGAIEPEHIAALEFTRQVVQEALRLYPPAAVVPRKAIRGVTIGRNSIAAGETVYVPIYAVHRHRALWREPERFDPGRFSLAATKTRHRYAYLPFGAGPRTCIGMSFALTEAVAILATLARRFRLTGADEAAPKVRLMVTLRPVGGMPMRVERR